MSNQKINVSIDVTKLDKSRFFKGAKGTYCDLVLWPTPGGQYGDFMVKQAATKAERSSGNYADLPILGNAKFFGGDRPETREAAPPPRRGAAGVGSGSSSSDEIPFARFDPV